MDLQVLLMAPVEARIDHLDLDLWMDHEEGRWDPVLSKDREEVHQLACQIRMTDQYIVDQVLMAEKSRKSTGG